MTWGVRPARLAQWANLTAGARTEALRRCDFAAFALVMLIAARTIADARILLPPPPLCAAFPGPSPRSALALQGGTTSVSASTLIRGGVVRRGRPVVPRAVQPLNSLAPLHQLQRACAVSSTKSGLARSIHHHVDYHAEYRAMGPPILCTAPGGSLTSRTGWFVKLQGRWLPLAGPYILSGGYDSYRGP